MAGGHRQENQRTLPGAFALKLHDDAGLIGRGRCCFRNESGVGVALAQQKRKKPQGVNRAAEFGGG